ncbi:helix-turn-helix domain-containing protein [Rathayibacter tritici]|uniref:helix-turn-helix domain-containing protein n=1 Tax=Rathayibacter tritici TaxID=33888 RepID=UPI00358DFC37
MKIAKAKGKLRGRKPKLSPKIEAHLVAEHRAGNYTVGELAAEFHVARSTVYQADACAASSVDVALALPPEEAP